MNLLFIANRQDLAKLTTGEPCGCITVRVVPISMWSPEGMVNWVVCGTDPNDQQAPQTEPKA